MLRTYFASSLVVLFLGLGCPVSFAQDSFQGNDLHVSRPPVTMPVNNTYGGEDVPLRGHLTTIPKGTMMMIKLDHPVSSYSSKLGDPVSAIVEADVFMNSQVVVPAGSQVEGSVTGVSPAGHLGKAGALELQFYTVKTPSGLVIPLKAHVVTDDSTGVIRGDTAQAQVLKTVGSAAGGTAAGTLLGTAAGSILGSVGTGATFGVAAGGIFGIGYAIAREGKQVVIPSGARMSIVLDQPVAAN